MKLLKLEIIMLTASINKVVCCSPHLLESLVESKILKKKFKKQKGNRSRRQPKSNGMTTQAGTKKKAQRERDQGHESETKLRESMERSEPWGNGTTKVRDSGLKRRKT